MRSNPVLTRVLDRDWAALPYRIPAWYLVIVARQCDLLPGELRANRVQTVAIISRSHAHDDPSITMANFIHVCPSQSIEPRSGKVQPESLGISFVVGEDVTIFKTGVREYPDVRIVPAGILSYFFAQSPASVLKHGVGRFCRIDILCVERDDTRVRVAKTSTLEHGSVERFFFLPYGILGLPAAPVIFLQ